MKFLSKTKHREKPIFLSLLIKLLFTLKAIQIPKSQNRGFFGQTVTHWQHKPIGPPFYAFT